MERSCKFYFEEGRIIITIEGSDIRANNEVERIAQYTTACVVALHGICSHLDAGYKLGVIADIVDFLADRTDAEIIENYDSSKDNN